MNVCKLTSLMYVEKTAIAQILPNHSHPATVQHTSLGFLCWTAARLWDGLHEDSPSDRLCATTADLAVEEGLWPQTARKGGFIPSPVHSQSNPGLCLHAFHAKGVTWNSGLAMGLHKTSSWALIPVVLLTHWVASGKSIGLSLNFHSWGGKKSVSRRHCVCYATDAFTAHFKISCTWFAFCQTSFIQVWVKKAPSMSCAHSRPL